MEPRVAGARGEERVGEQVDALLDRLAARVEQVHPAGRATEAVGLALRGVEALDDLGRTQGCPNAKKAKKKHKKHAKK